MVAAADIQSFTELMKLAEPDEKGFYWHADGAVSAIWLMHPVACQHVSGNSRLKIADAIGHAIGSLPAGATVQAIFRNSRYVDWALNNYLANGGSTHPWLRQYELARVKAMREWSETLQEMVQADVNVKDQQVLFCVTIYEPQQNAIVQAFEDIKDALGRPDPAFAHLPPVKWTKAHRRTIEKVQKLSLTVQGIRAQFDELFKGRGIPAIHCTLETLLRFCRAQNDPRKGGLEPVIVNPDALIPEQVCTNRVEIRDEGKYVYCNGTWAAIMTLEKFPEPIYPGCFSLNNPDLADDASPLDFLGDGIFCVSGKVVERSEAMAWLDDKERRQSGKDHEGVAAQRAREDVHEMKDWVYNAGRSLVDCCVSVKVTGERRDEVDLKCENMKSSLKPVGGSWVVEQTDVKTHFCEQMPGGFNTSVSDGALRVKRKRDILFGAMLPIYGSGRGARNFMRMAMNEHYELYAFNPFEANAYNTWVCAESGGGKSVEIGCMVRDFLRKDSSRAYIIDYGGSFVDTVSLLDEDGLQVPVSFKNQQPINPFAGPADVVIPNLLNWIPARALAPGEHLDPEIRAKISKTLGRTFDKLLIRDKRYRDIDEIPERYPGMFPTNARKRIRIDYLPPVSMSAVQRQLKGAPEDIPHYTVFYVVRIDAFTPKGASKRSARRLSDLPKQEQESLRSLFNYIDEDEVGPYVLTGDGTAIEQLASRGYEARFDTRCMVADIEREQDLGALLRCNVKVQFDAEYIAQHRQTLQASFGSRKDADPAAVASRIEQEIKRLDPREYFRAIEGLVDLQQEVVFSNFIEQVQHDNDPELVRFITRLSLWYGDGQYAETFDRKGGPDFERYRLLYWDFKPIATSDRNYFGALLSTVLMRIQVHCNSVASMRYKKMIVIDEFHEFKTIDRETTVRFVDSTTLQARKNGYGVICGSQKIDHAIETGIEGIDLLGQFQHYYIGPQNTDSLELLQSKFKLSDEAMGLIAKAGKRDGKFTEFTVYIPKRHSVDRVRSVLTPFEYWLSTTKNEERDIKSTLIDKYIDERNETPGRATILGCLEASRQYPRGLPTSVPEMK